jgi:5-keto 4-deoxyuronate isomerase
MIVDPIFSRGDFTFLSRENFRRRKEFVVLEIKKKLKLSVEVDDFSLNLLDASFQNNNEMTVAMGSFNGKLEIYLVSISVDNILSQRKIFAFNDEKFPIFKLAFCPYNKFEHI